MKGLRDNHLAAWSEGLLALKLSEEAPGRSRGGPKKIFRPQTPFEMHHHGIKFRICLISCCGGRGVRESAFSLAWLAEELIHRNIFTIL